MPFSHLDAAIARAGLTDPGADLVRLAAPPIPPVVLQAADLVRAQLAHALKQVARSRNPSGRRLAALGGLLELHLLGGGSCARGPGEALSDYCHSLTVGADPLLAHWSRQVLSALEADDRALRRLREEWSGPESALRVLRALARAAVQQQFDEARVIHAEPPVAPDGISAPHSLPPEGSEALHQAENVLIPASEPRSATSDLHDAPCPSSTAVSEPLPPTPSDKGWGTKWSDLTLALKDGHTIMARSVTGRVKTVGFADLRLSDGRRSEPTPSAGWWILVLLLRDGGEIYWEGTGRQFVGKTGQGESRLKYRYTTPDDKSTFKTALSELRKKLRDYFGIPKNPSRKQDHEPFEQPADEVWRATFKCDPPWGDEDPAF